MNVSPAGSSPAQPMPSVRTAPVTNPSSKVAVNAKDTVKLSQTAQVRSLKQQGQSASQIASNLSIPVATVDGFLGIVLPVATAAPAPAPMPIPAKG